MEELGEREAAERYDDFKEINDGLWREYERGEISKKNLMTARFQRFFCAAERQGGRGGGEPPVFYEAVPHGISFARGGGVFAGIKEPRKNFF